MGKKRSTRQNNFKEEIMEVVRIIEKDNGQTFFEIEDTITQDVAEAVSILMRRKDIDNKIWSKEINIDLDRIDSRKCLYWLSGGDTEWIKLTNYKKPWIECDDFFVNEFDFVVRWVLKKSKTLKEIKESFTEYLNLPVLYEFALSKGIVR